MPHNPIDLTSLIKRILDTQLEVAETQKIISNCQHEMEEIERRIVALKAMKMREPVLPPAELDPHDGVPADTGNH